MINRLVSEARSRNTTQEIQTLIKDVWQQIKMSKSSRNNIEFLKEIVRGNQRFEIQPTSLIWHRTRFDIVFFNEVDGQVLAANDAFTVPLTDSNLAVFLRVELYHALLREYDICTQDTANAVWESVLDLTT